MSANKEAESLMLHAAACELADRLHHLSEGRAAPVALFVPVAPKNKQPIVKHAATSAETPWTDEESQKWLAEKKGRDFRVGVLLYGLFVIDFDVHGLYTDWAAEFPEMEAAPAERTRKGVHVYFQRCPAVEAAGLFDGPLTDPTTNKKANIDRKTITATGTGGLLVCAPTPNYEWLPGRSLLEVAPPVMSAELLAKVVRYSQPKKRPRAHRPAATEPGAPEPAEPSISEKRPKTQIQINPMLAPVEDFRELLRLFNFPLDTYGSVQQRGASAEQFAKFSQVEELRARPIAGKACYMCGDEHTNQIVGNVTLRGGCYRLQVRHFRAKENPKCRKLHTISAAAREEYIRDFKKQPQVDAAEAAAVVEACVSAGMYFSPNSSQPRVWRLADPAPGFISHAVLAADDWRLLLRPSTGTGAWRRRTLLPGLYYEYLDASAWTATDPDAPKPPFMQG